MPHKDPYGEALARSKEGMPLSKEQQSAMDREAAKHRAFKKMVSDRPVQGLRKSVKAYENLK